MSNESDDDYPLVVRALAAVDELDGMYQLLILFSIITGLGFIAFGAYLVGLVWLLGGPGFVLGMQRWED